MIGTWDVKPTILSFTNVMLRASLARPGAHAPRDAQHAEISSGPLRAAFRELDAPPGREGGTAHEEIVRRSDVDGGAVGAKASALLVGKDVRGGRLDRAAGADARQNAVDEERRAACLAAYRTRAAGVVEAALGRAAHARRWPSTGAACPCARTSAMPVYSCIFPTDPVGETVQ